jgi:hypothetical protein
MAVKLSRTHRSNETPRTAAWLHYRICHESQADGSARGRREPVFGHNVVEGSLTFNSMNAANSKRRHSTAKREA